MAWDVEILAEFVPEVRAWSRHVRVAFGQMYALLEEHGPALGRPDADTLNGSRHANMKELRFNAGEGVWRVAFAFDPERRAILLVGGDKRGKNARRFYRALIRTADERFDRHLENMEE